MTDSSERQDPNSQVTVTLEMNVTDDLSGEESQVLGLHSSYETGGDVYDLADHAVTAMCREVTGLKAGWARRSVDSGQYDDASGGNVTMRVGVTKYADYGTPRVRVSDATRRAFTVAVSTNANVVNSLEQATSAVTDDAQAWLMSLKNEDRRKRVRGGASVSP